MTLKDIYEITLISSEDSLNFNIAGGYFQYVPREIIGEDIVGKLVDEKGVSYINGQFVDSMPIKNLSFDRIFNGMDTHYQFSYNRGSCLWVGFYQGNECGRGKAICRVRKAFAAQEIADFLDDFSILDEDGLNIVNFAASSDAGAGDYDEGEVIGESSASHPLIHLLPPINGGDEYKILTDEDFR